MVCWGSVFGEFLMGTHLENMAAWSSAVDAASLPPSVDVRCRMQMLHIVTQIQGSQPIPALRAAGPARGAARLVDGGSTSIVAAARVHAARAAQADTLDFVIGGATGVGAVTAALACGKGRSLGDLVCAVAAGNEVAGRVGAGMVLGPHHGMANGWVVSVRLPSPPEDPFPGPSWRARDAPRQSVSQWGVVWRRRSWRNGGLKDRWTCWSNRVD